MLRPDWRGASAVLASQGLRVPVSGKVMLLSSCVLGLRSLWSSQDRSLRVAVSDGETFFIFFLSFFFFLQMEALIKTFECLPYS